MVRSNIFQIFDIFWFTIDRDLRQICMTIAVGSVEDNDGPHAWNQ